MNKQTQIDELKQKILSLEKGVKNSVWNTLNDKVKSLSKNEVDRVLGTEKVKVAKNKMLDAFINYFLFDKFKDEFACSSVFRPFVDDYIKVVCDVVDNTSAELQKENEALKKRIEELERLKK